MASLDERIHNSGPLKVLGNVAGKLYDDGWYDVNLDRMRSNIAFMQQRATIGVVQNISSNALFNGNILVHFGGKSSKAEDPFVVHQRSDMWKRWAIEVKMRNDANGIIPVCWAENDSHPAIVKTDKYRPAILNMQMVRRMRCKVTLDSTMIWKLYGHGVADGANPDDKFLIQGVFVIVGEVPLFDGNGLTLVSRVERVRKAFALADNKIVCEIEADTRRAFDDPVTQQADSDRSSGSSRNPHNPALLTSGEFPSTGAAAADNSCTPSERRQMLAYKVALGNSSVAAQNAHKQAEENDHKAPPVMSTRRLPPGYSLVPNYKPAEAPKDTYVAMEAALNEVCQQWGIPKNMLSTGDVTGKPKLSEAGASVEMGMVFRDSQAASRKWIETEIENMYFRMYFEDRLAKHTAEWEEEHIVCDEPVTVSSDSKTKGKKRKAAPVTPSDEEVEQKIEKEMHVTVALPGTIPFSTVTSLYSAQMIEWTSARELLSRSLGVPINTFPVEPPPTELENEITKIKAKPAAASASKPASKKAKS